MSKTIEFTDRYQARGMPYPEPETVCQGDCEGMGCVPIKCERTRRVLKLLGLFIPYWKTKWSTNDERYRELWQEAEQRDISDDGWHFVTCPYCNGTGKHVHKTETLLTP